MQVLTAGLGGNGQHSMALNAWALVSCGSEREHDGGGNITEWLKLAELLLIVRSGIVEDERFFCSALEFVKNRG